MSKNIITFSNSTTPLDKIGLSRISIFVVFLFLFSCSNSGPKVIGVQTPGNFNETDKDAVIQALTDFYSVEVIKLASDPLPQSAFVKIKIPRYRADKLLAHLKSSKPDSCQYIIGLTSSDISFTKKINGKVKKPESRYYDWGIFGLANRPGIASIISSHRLKHPDQNRYQNRLVKICIHEFGHNLGLNHCPNRECIMQDAAESIATIDLVQLNMCERCKKRIE